MNKLIAAVVGISLGLAVVAPLTVSAAYVDPFTDACSGAPDATVCKDSKKSQTPTDNAIFGANGILTKALSLVSIVIGVGAVAMIIFGGFKYVTSAGDANQAASARSTVIYALAGILTAIFAQGLVLFVLDKL